MPIYRRVLLRIAIDQYISYRQFKATISSVTPPFITFAISAGSPESKRLFSLRISHLYNVRVPANRKAQPIKAPKAA